MLVIVEPIHYEKGTSPASPIKLRDTLPSTLIQVTAVLLGILALDDGRLFGITVAAAGAYWVAIAVINRRNQRWGASMVDQVVIRWGYVVMLFAAFVAARFLRP